MGAALLISQPTTFLMDDLVQWQKVRYTHTKFAVDWRYVYRKADQGMENFESMRAFVDVGVASESIYRKNYTQKVPPKNNCMHDASIDRVTCTLGARRIDELKLNPLKINDRILIC
jgi:hypothetical protein